MLSLLNIDYSSMISTLPLDSGSSDSLSNFINNGLVGLVTEADTTYKIAGSVIALILALIGCFFGYKLSRLFMGITGFIAGAIIGQIVASQILHVEGFASVLCIILCGAFIASLAFWIYRIGIFILCFALAFSAAGTLFPFEGDVQFFANVITGLIVGVLAVKYMRPVIILTSAIVCGTSAAGLLPGVTEYMGITTLSSLNSSAALTLALCVLGIAVQFLTTKEPVKKTQNLFLRNLRKFSKNYDFSEQPMHKTLLFFPKNNFSCFQRLLHINNSLIRRTAEFKTNILFFHNERTIYKIINLF